MPSLFHFRREKSRSSTDRPGSSQTSPLVPNSEIPASDNGPILATSGVLPTNLALASPPEELPAINPIPEKLAEAWNAVKDGATVADASRGLDAIGVSSAP